MSLSKVRKRLMRFEDTLARTRLGEVPLSGQGGTGAAKLLRQLQELEADAQRVKQKAEDECDYRIALAAIRELCQMVEFRARLTGDLQEKPRMSIDVQLDAETGTRIAKTYLERHDKGE